MYALAGGIFAMTTSEFMVSGLSLPMAADLGVDLAAIGYLISAFAGAMAVGGPLLALALLRRGRRRALVVVVALFLVGQVVATVAPSYPVLLVARILTGTAASAFFGVALAIAADRVQADRRGRASSVVLGGLMIGTVAGLPLAVLVGEAAGWRVSFAAVVVVATAAGAIAWRLTPPDAGDPSTRVVDELAALRSGRLWAAFSTSLLVIGATFAAFSYLPPILTGVSGFGTSAVPWLLAAYGGATVVGNAVVGRVADRAPVRVLATGLVFLAVFLALFAAGAADPAVAVASMVGIGLVGVTMNPALVARVMRVADPRPLVNTVHTAVITTGVLVGSAAGAAALDLGWGLTAPPWIGAVLAVLGLLTLVPEAVRRRPARPDPGTVGATSLVRRRP